jgi:hypothetical protein
MHVKKTALLAVAALALLALSSTGAYARPAGQVDSSVGTITLNEQNGSGESGGATLSGADTQLTVTISLSNGTAEPQPAHIHKGTCANLDPKPLYPLNNVVNGKSETTLPITLGDLMGGEYAINVHKSATAANIYVACGDLSTLTRAGGINGGTTGGTTPGMPTTGNADRSLLAILTLLALALLGTGMKYSRQDASHRGGA